MGTAEYSGAPAEVDLIGDTILGEEMVIGEWLMKEERNARCIGVGCVYRVGFNSTKGVSRFRSLLLRIRKGRGNSVDRKALT